MKHSQSTCPAETAGGGTKFPKNRRVSCCRGFRKTISQHWPHHAINTHTHTHTGGQCIHYIYIYIGSDDSTTFGMFVLFLFCIIPLETLSRCVILAENLVRLQPSRELRLVGHGRMEHLSSRLKQPIPIPPIPLERFQWNSWMLFLFFPISLALSWLTC